MGICLSSHQNCLLSWKESIIDAPKGSEQCAEKRKIPLSSFAMVSNWIMKPIQNMATVYLWEQNLQFILKANQIVIN